jgi:rifampicin phosphotransferase
MTYTIDFENPRANAAALTGGKGASLAKLTQAAHILDVNVPKGFVVTQEVHDMVLYPIKGLVRRMDKIQSTDHQGLSKLYERMCDILLKAPFDRALEREVFQKIKTLTGPLAIRSSATCEDSGQSAFAGQHDTFLNVKGDRDVLDALKKCFVSFYAPQAVIYRRQSKAPMDARMAVVVQEMALCDRAGVAFNIHPVTGAMDQCVINANFGLGESVVSGTCDVDQYVYDRKEAEIVQASIAQKTMWIVHTEKGTKEVSDKSVSSPCLKDEEICAIAELTAKVSTYMGYPQDIEWGYVEGQLVLLQSRPITRLPERLTRDEAAERFPNPVTPMTWGLVETGFHRSLEASFALMDLPAYDGKWFVARNHYIYGNQCVVELYHELAATKTMNFDFSDEGLKALGTKVAEIERFARDWQVNLERYISEISVLGKKSMNEPNLEECWDHVEAINETCARFFEPNIAISLFHTGLSKALLTAVEMVMGESRGRELLNDLKAGISTRTSFVNREMMKLGALLRHDPEFLDVVKSLQAGERSAEALIASGALSSNTDFEKAFSSFIRDFGHREVDFDPYHAPWGDAPEMLLAQIIAMASSRHCDLSQDQLLEARADDKARAFHARQRLLLAAPQEAAFVLSALVDLVCYFEELDDLEHYSTSRVTRPIRQALLAVGTKLTHMGILSGPRDVWMIEPDHLRTTLQADTPRAWATLARETKQAKVSYETACKCTPDWNFGDVEVEPSRETVENSLRGLPGSAGQIEGEVFVLESGADFKNFPKGAVLVARTTSPAWTPLFYNACAVITASGGPLSHGAVTAREVGIPAVMSVKSALTHLYNGLRVRVDGTTGRIDLLEGT